MHEESSGERLVWNGRTIRNMTQLKYSLQWKKRRKNKLSQKVTHIN